MHTATALADRLTTVRSRTLDLLAPLDAAAMSRTPDPILSPPLWDLGHIAAYEELWLLQRVAGRPARYPELQATYDAFETPRAERASIEILDLDACHAYLDTVRSEVLELLDRPETLAGDDPLLRDGAVFEMVAQHEAQHAETVLQALQMLPAGGYEPARAALPKPSAPAPAGRVRIPAGEQIVGAAHSGFAYDCERPAHRVVVPEVVIARTPVTCAEHMAFIEDDGYRREELWSPSGWAWRVATDASAPLYWRASGPGAWTERIFDRVEPVDPTAPVCHVSWYEAEAHARWAGARLPTETEWERAARAGVDGSHPFPWGDEPEGRANLGARTFAPAPAGAFPGGAAPSGCLQLVGDVWEWTATEFAGYPGFRPFPYREYSEVFFGRGYRVLRGGSWATQAVAARSTFRNWDLPERRQIFAGFRLAWDHDKER